jgi:hypothetical protein
MADTPDRESTVSLGAFNQGVVNRRKFKAPARPDVKAKESEAPKRRVSFHLTDALAERVRNTVYYLSGPPHRLTMASLAEAALARELSRLEREANGGKPYARRGSELVGGRPVAAPAKASAVGD